jgi:hypothetical protein
MHTTAKIVHQTRYLKVMIPTRKRHQSTTAA